MRARGFLKVLCSAPCLAVLACAAASGLAWWGASAELRSAPLRLRRVRSVEPGPSSSLDVLRAAGSVEGRSFLDRSCAARLRESLTRSVWVKEVKVTRAHKGRLVARVRLREPFCAVQGCDWCVLDEEAVVLPARSTRFEDIAVIKGCTVKRVEPGKRWPDPELAGAVEVLSGLRKAARVREVRILREGGKVSYIGVLSSGTKVLWGERGGGRDKVGKFLRALDAAKRTGRRASYIDLRFSRPVFGFAEGG